MPLRDDEKQILEEVSKYDFDIGLIRNYEMYFSNKVIKNMLFDRFLKMLVDLDIDIAILYETTSDEDWERLHAIYETPFESVELNELKEKIDKYVYAHKIMQEFLKEIKIGRALRLIEKNIFCGHTRNIQFLFFDIAKTDSKRIFTYLASLIAHRENCEQYLPYYITFLVRFKLNKKVINDSFRFYVNYMKKHETDISVQYFLYGMCFLKIPEYEGLAIEFFEKYKHRIKIEISEKFANIFSVSFKVKNDQRVKNEILEYFPFDLPIIGQIEDIYAKKYINFDE